MLIYNDNKGQLMNDWSIHARIFQICHILSMKLHVLNLINVDLNEDVKFDKS